MTSTNKIAGLLIGISLQAFIAIESRAEDSTSCLFNGQQRLCRVEVSGDDLTLRLEDNRTIEVQRRGRCTDRRKEGITTRSCNVRIGLPDDFVYGLIVRSSQDGTTISSPRLEIELPELAL